MMVMRVLVRDIRKKQNLKKIEYRTPINLACTADSADRLVRYSN